MEFINTYALMPLLHTAGFGSVTCGCWKSDVWC